MREERIVRSEHEAPVMENVTVMDRECYFEAAAARGRTWKTRLCTAVGVVVMATGLFLTHAVFFVLGLAATLLAVCSHMIVASHDFNKLKRLHPDGTWTKTIRFYEDRIETDSGTGTPSVANYTDIKREHETRQMYVIDFDGLVPATTFRKDSFTVGSMDALRTFLVEKQREEYGEKPGRGRG